MKPMSNEECRLKKVWISNQRDMPSQILFGQVQLLTAVLFHPSILGTCFLAIPLDFCSWIILFQLDGIYYLRSYSI